MNVLARWFGSTPKGPPLDAARWVVMDVETSGLDMRNDQLLAVAAVALHFGADRAPRVALADSFEAVLQHESPSTDKDNILLHGIGVAAQRAGAPAAQVLQALEQWVGASPLIAFHAAFDEAMLGRAMQRALGHGIARPWLDLAPVAAGLHPRVRARALDEWLDHFGIDCAVRHQAAADALATAELLLRLWPAARARRCDSFDGLATLARHQRWLGHGG